MHTEDGVTFACDTRSDKCKNINVVLVLAGLSCGIVRVVYLFQGVLTFTTMCMLLYAVVCV